jgi:hypothetical protein
VGDVLANKFKSLVSAYLPIPTTYINSCVDYDDDATIVASNTSRALIAGATCHTCTVNIVPTHGIADTGASLIFIKDDAPALNKQPTTNPITVNLPDGRKVCSTHTCDVVVPGLPQPLTGHIVPNLAIALLFGIRPLCKARCGVWFYDKKCDVWYEGWIILTGYKNLSTDLWTLPFNAVPAVPIPQTSTSPGTHPAIATFTHLVRTCMNAVKFTHQSLGNPPISTLLKAVRQGFVRGYPNISKQLILNYLNPSPAMAKGHMKRPQHRLRSTTPWISLLPPQEAIEYSIMPEKQVIPAVADALLLHIPEFLANNAPHALHQPNLIVDNEIDESIANVFAFVTFANKNSGIVYHDLTGSFPFMFLDGSVCFFALYHYESNSILAMPLKGLDDISIFNMYKMHFNILTSKGFKPKLNVMDNQATKQIKQFLTKQDCRLQLVEPHNHHVNAAERAIQMFKNAFIAALATTDSEFSLQLWDKLTPQVQDTLNLMHASRINPTISMYKALNGPYNWNRYPLAPLGCKAVTYKDDNTCGSWALRGIDGWYLGPSRDHY